MKIRRIKVLLAKGWYVAVWCVSYSLFSMICGFASARESAVRDMASQDTLKAGDIISGVVSDNEGPMMMVNVTERDSAYRVVAHSVTDIEGNFSFRLVNPGDRLQVSYVGYGVVDTVINSRYFDIKLKESELLPKVDITSDRRIVTMYGPLQPSLNNTGPMRTQTIDMDEFEGLGITTVDDNLQAYGPPRPDIVIKRRDRFIMENTGYHARAYGPQYPQAGYPLLVLDGDIQDPLQYDLNYLDSLVSDNLSMEKADIARLFGMRKRQIKTFSVLKDDAAISAWGQRGVNGVIEVSTRKGNRKLRK